MTDSKNLKLWESFLSGLAGAVIAAAVTYWSAIDKSKNEAVLRNALADTKEQYLLQIKDSIAKIAKSEANAENAVIDSQKLVVKLASIEERANTILNNLNSAEKSATRKSITLDKETLASIQSGVVEDIEKIQMPSGAVLAFNSTFCPQGWKDYAPAYGKFIRGIDKSGRIDPEGIRLPGSSQEDEFKSHTHKANMEIGAEPTSGGAQAAEAAGAHGRIGSMYTSSGLLQTTGGLETRPKNIALLYCEKA